MWSFENRSFRSRHNRLSCPGSSFRLQKTPRPHPLPHTVMLSCFSDLTQSGQSFASVKEEVSFGFNLETPHAAVDLDRSLKSECGELCFFLIHHRLSLPSVSDSKRLFQSPGSPPPPEPPGRRAANLFDRQMKRRCCFLQN